MGMKNHKKIIAICVLITFTLFSFSFALVPLYSALCKVTGLTGKVNLVRAIPETNQTIQTRQLTMEFVALKNTNLNWDFYPQKNKIEIHPEENNKMFFYVKNNTSQTITVQAIPSVTPWQAASHLHKAQCFCFEQQTLKPHASLMMPVVFRFDKALPADIKTVTLAYTLFKVK
jgi:cytochrome c oxidase assembly protein subunit 11